MSREPVMFWGSLGMLVGLILRYFIPEVSDQFINLLIDVLSVAGPTLMGLVYARSKVSPVDHDHSS